ncbi:DUF3618 domain-containing protein [Phenylobacterium sp.]|jgi:hypothetical protein|uniref:DUF3618 domain-containing protein n=1 Tax=Phenylobacterium sp. TaxID=1871053 RepID=UPI003783B22F
MTTTKSAAEVELEVEASRLELERTVEALKEKMAPSELFGDAGRAMGQAGNRIMMKAIDQAKENPIPMALIGLGLAWLATSGARRAYSSGSYSSAYGEADYYGEATRGPSIRSRVSDKAHSAADRASGAVADAKTRIGDAAASAREQGRHALDGLSTKAGQIRDQAGVYGQKVKRQAVDTFESEPLLLTGVGLAVGVALGAALPATQTERRYIGPTRDKLLGRGRDLAREQIDSVKGVAQSAYGRVKEELGREGDLASRLGGAASAGAQTVRDGLKSSGGGDGLTSTH